MIELHPLWLVVAGELVLALVAALMVMVLLNARRRRRDRQAAMALVDYIKQYEGQRLDGTRKLLEGPYRYQGGAIDQTARNLVKVEKLLYQRIVNMYLRRDPVALEQIHVDVEAATDAYRGLTVPAGGGGGAAPAAPAPAASSEEGASEEELERLRAENQSLNDELQITMETMGRMLSEYAAMFGGAGGDAVDKGRMLEMLNEGGADAPPAAQAPPPVAEPIVETPEAPEADELEEISADDGVRPPAAAPLDDATVRLDARADVDLSDTDLDAVFMADDEPASPKAETDDEMDDDLADMWADALEEQKDPGKTK